MPGLSLDQLGNGGEAAIRPIPIHLLGIPFKPSFGHTEHFSQRLTSCHNLTLVEFEISQCTLVQLEISRLTIRQFEISQCTLVQLEISRLTIHQFEISQCPLVQFAIHRFTRLDCTAHHSSRPCFTLEQFTNFDGAPHHTPWQRFTFNGFPRARSLRNQLFRPDFFVVPRYQPPDNGSAAHRSIVEQASCGCLQRFGEGSPPSGRQHHLAILSGTFPFIQARPSQSASFVRITTNKQQAQQPTHQFEALQRFVTVRGRQSRKRVLLAIV
ncbi:MAG: hypothetical protein CMJ65_12860 [Planctomycetaceae bacterium]|nr:hypothetical protein [Planctomycetaceae bacterium]